MGAYPRLSRLSRLTGNVHFVGVGHGDDAETRDFFNTLLHAAAKRIRTALPNDGTHLLVGMGSNDLRGGAPAQSSDAESRTRARV
jgi:hypothetical protein